MAVSDGSILLRIKGDSSDAVRELNKVQKEAKDLTPNLDGLSKVLGGLASPAALATAGITALGAGAVAAGLALFNITKTAAAYGSEIYNASVKTGLTTETISALKVASERTGVSMESLGTIVSRFSRLVGEAQQGSEKAAETLTRLGITPQEAVNNLDGALGKVFQRIQDLPNPIEKATLAQQAFGKAGTELLKVIDDFNGDLPKAIEHARKLGLVMSKEDAAAADEFGDQMDTLNRQIQSVGFTIGREFMPVFLEMAKEVGKFVTENKEGIRSWGEETANTLIGLAAYWRDAAKAVREYGHWFGVVQLANVPGSGGINLLQLLGPAGAAIDLANRRGAQQRVQTAPSAFGGAADAGFELDPVTNTLRPRTRTGADSNALTNFDAIKKAQEDAKKAAEKAQKEAEELRKRQLQGQLGQLKTIQAAEQHALDRITAANKAAFEARQIDAKTYLAQRLADEEEFAKGAIEDITREYELKRKEEGLSSEQLKALKLEEDLELQKIVDARFEREEVAKKEAAEQTKKLTDEELEAAKEAMERKIALSEAELAKRIAVVENLAAHEKKTAEEVAKFKQFVEVENLDLRKRELEKYFKLLTVGSREYLDVQNQIKILEEQLEEQRKKNHTEDRKRHNERIKNWNEYIEKIYQAQKAEDERQQKAAEADAIRLQRENSFSLGGFGGGLAGGLGINIPLFDPEITDQIAANAGFLGKVYEDLAATAGNALGQMAAGLANLALQWLITGEFSAAAALKMAAGIALGVAQEAIIKGFFNIAEGLAAAANPFTAWMAPGYFAAAKAYFVTAAIAGAAGIALGLGARAAGGGGKSAQGAFAQQTSGTTQQRNVAGQGQAYSQYGDKAYIQEEGRNAPLGVDVRIKFEDKPAWFTQMFVSEWRANGRIRRLVEDGR